MEKIQILLSNRHLNDLNPILVGSERCSSGHSFGPAARKHTLLHYVVSGKGVFYTGGVAYPVKAGEVFRILPEEIAMYRADEKDPWSYRWIGFDGNLSARFATLPPVFPLPPGTESCFSLEDGEDGMIEYRVASRLFRLYAELFRAQRKGNYVRRAQDYIQASYMLKLRVEEIADHMHLDRRYLSRVFRQKTGQTIQEYIISTRMEEAIRCLRNGLSVGESAERCGYADVFLFSKMFKRRFGVSPANWKKGRHELEKNEEEEEKEPDDL